MKLEQLTHTLHVNQEEAIAEAVEIGVDKMWVDSILSRYLKKGLPRRKAIQLVGLENVRTAELQDMYARQDVAWGLRGHKARS
jgi:hypothetical protein